MENKDTKDFKKRSLKKGRRGNFNPGRDFIIAKTDEYLKAGGTIKVPSEDMSTPQDFYPSEDIYSFLNPPLGKI